LEFETKKGNSILVKTKTQCHISGENFSPGVAEESLGHVFAEIKEAAKTLVPLCGDSQYAMQGRAVLLFEEAEEWADPVSAEQLTEFSRCIRECSRAGATVFQLEVNVSYYGQCNLELSADFLNAMACLGVTIVFDCAEDDSLKIFDRYVLADHAILSGLLGVTEVEFTENILPAMKRDFEHALAEIGNPADFDIILWGDGLDSKMLVSSKSKKEIIPTGVRLKKYLITE
jgi:hypothetical protein